MRIRLCCEWLCVDCIHVLILFFVSFFVQLRADLPFYSRTYSIAYLQQSLAHIFTSREKKNCKRLRGYISHKSFQILIWKAQFPLLKFSSQESTIICNYLVEQNKASDFRTKRRRKREKHSISVQLIGNEQYADSTALYVSVCLCVRSCVS